LVRLGRQRGRQPVDHIRIDVLDDVCGVEVREAAPEAVRLKPELTNLQAGGNACIRRGWWWYSCVSARAPPSVKHGLLLMQSCNEVPIPQFPIGRKFQ
jgi:hypothetical protein